MKKKDKLTNQEILEFKKKQDFDPGDPYVFVMDYGWTIIGFYICHSTPLTIRVAMQPLPRLSGTDESNKLYEKLFDIERRLEEEMFNLIKE